MNEVRTPFILRLLEIVKFKFKKKPQAVTNIIKKENKPTNQTINYCEYTKHSINKKHAGFQAQNNRDGNGTEKCN